MGNPQYLSIQNFSKTLVLLVTFIDDTNKITLVFSQGAHGRGETI